MSDIGETLRDARYGRGVTIEDAATATRIKPVFLEALENGEYHLLPGPAYASGFLRNYASYLGLAPDDILQEYHRLRPPVQATVRPATRVLSNGHDRQRRNRIMWVLTSIVILLASGYAWQQYQHTTHAQSAPPVNLTPANLGETTSGVHVVNRPTAFWLGLHATAPVWVRVTSDGHRVYQGILQPKAGKRHWKAYHAVYIATLDGSHIRVSYDGKRHGLVATRPGLVLDVATRKGVRRVS